MLYFIPTPIGNLSDISYRALEVLQKCEILLCEDTRNTKSLINLLNLKFNLNLNFTSYISLHSHNENEFLSSINLDFFDKNVAYLSDAGMPAISDPGCALIEYAIKNNINYEVLTGANAALVALVSSGFCKKEFIFLGFLSNTGDKRLKDIEKMMLNPYPSIIYESSKRLISLIENICDIDQEKQIFAIKEISKKFEKKFKAKAKDLLNILKDENLNGEWVIVVDSNENEFVENRLCEKDILSLSLPIKIKSKLLSKINGKNPKEIYQKLLLSEN